MKNKFLSIVCVFCIAIIGALNVNLTSIENGDVDLVSIINLSSANAEDSPYPPPVGGDRAVCHGCENDLNWPWQWNQGLTKDEREWTRPCPDEDSSSTSVDGDVDTPQGGGGVGVIHSSSQSNSGGRQDISCPFGYDNCTAISC